MTTMSKMNKTVGKFKLWAILSALVIAAGIVILAVFGFNPDTTVSDVKTLSVELESYVEISDARVESVKEICESEFEKAGLKDAYTVKADMSNGGEFLYVFDKNTDDAKLNEAKTAIGVALDAASSADIALYSSVLKFSRILLKLSMEVSAVKRSANAPTYATDVVTGIRTSATTANVRSVPTREETTPAMPMFSL